MPSSSDHLQRHSRAMQSNSTPAAISVLPLVIGMVRLQAQLAGVARATAVLDPE